MTIQKKKVLIVAPSFQTVFHAAIYKQLKKLFRPEDITIRSLSGDLKVQNIRLLDALKQIQPSALLSISVRPDVETVTAYKTENVPIILIDEEMEGVSTIATNNALGGQIAGEYFVSKGKKQIAVVCGQTQVKGGYNAEQRLKGFREAILAARLSLSTERIVEVIDYSREEGLEVLPKLLEKGIDAIFCAAGDNCAVGLVTAAIERGIHIPEDIAIIGFDDMLVARVSNPQLTTIKQPLNKIADAAYRMAMIEGEQLLHAPRKSMFDPELIVRQSA